MSFARHIRNTLLTLCAVGVIPLALTSCAPATAPVVDLGPASSCPGEFLTYVKKTATLQNQPGAVEEIGTDSFTALDGIEPLCVIARAGTRKLPSGNPEPTEYTALINAETLSFNALVTTAKGQGYKSDAPPTGGDTQARLSKDITYLTVEQFPGATLGLPDQDTPYLILTSITSEEVARIREAGPPSGSR